MGATERFQVEERYGQFCISNYTAYTVKDNLQKAKLGVTPLGMKPGGFDGTIQFPERFFTLAFYPPEGWLVLHKAILQNKRQVEDDKNAFPGEDAHC